MRGGLSGEALNVARQAELRRSRRVGTVVILDILTNDPGDAPERIGVEENSNEDATQEDQNN